MTTDNIQNPTNSQQPAEEPLFVVAMQWGLQPVRLTAWRCDTLPGDAPTTSVHIVALHGGKVLVVRDRKGQFGFPGGRLEPEETREQALAREAYEEANAHLLPEYSLFAVLKIECTERLPDRTYPHAFTYMAMYAGYVRALDPIRRDPAGIITARALFSRDECLRLLDRHDQILLREALFRMNRTPLGRHRVRAFLGDMPDFPVVSNVEEPERERPV